MTAKCRYCGSDDHLGVDCDRVGNAKRDPSRCWSCGEETHLGACNYMHTMKGEPMAINWADLLNPGEVYTVRLGYEVDDRERIELSIDPVGEREVGLEIFQGDKQPSMLACLDAGQCRALAIALFAMAEVIEAKRAKG